MAFRSASTQTKSQNTALQVFLDEVLETARNDSSYQSLFVRLKELEGQSSLKILDPSDLASCAKASVSFCVLPFQALQDLSARVRTLSDQFLKKCDPKQRGMFKALAEGVELDLALAELLLELETERQSRSIDLMDHLRHAVFLIAMYDQMREIARLWPDKITLMGASEDFTDNKQMVFSAFDDYGDLAEEFCTIIGEGHEELVAHGRKLGRPAWEAMADHITLVGSGPLVTEAEVLVKKYRAKVAALRSATSDVTRSPIAVLDNPKFARFLDEVDASKGDIDRLLLSSAAANANVLRSWRMQQR